jgi:hypothetical protein
MNELSRKIEDIILQYDRRGMTLMQKRLQPGYCKRAAELLLQNKGVVAIGTGFPVARSFESDGPIGAIALYHVLAHLQYQPVMVCAPPISHFMQRRFDTYEIPLGDLASTRPSIRLALDTLKPAVVVSVERAGVTADGRYYNMHREDITEGTARFDIFLQECPCPSIAFGDGGNEIGMGNIREALAVTNIIPSVTTCDELVIAAVSNWGVYGVIGMLSYRLKEDLFGCFDPRAIAAELFSNGCVDGVTQRGEPGEDGFPIDTGLEVMQQIRDMVEAQIS